MSSRGGPGSRGGSVTAAEPDFGDGLAASSRIAAHIHDTPVMASASIDSIAGCRVHFKCEHLQRAGAFKFRGATNAVVALDDDLAARGVAAHSSGNHAAALALAARCRGIPCHVVMPATTPAAKRDAAADNGARIVLANPRSTPGPPHSPR
jgi:threonine dehydratase